MAYSFNLETSKQITLDEFIYIVNKELITDKPETLLNCVEASQMLSNNRSFLVDILNQNLGDFDNFQKENRHSSQTIKIFNNNKFYIRVNAWPKLEDDSMWQNELYQSLQAHDHNFDFLTVGYFGKGYKMTIYEYDFESVNGYIGENIEMKFLETTTLPIGKTMIYRASKDIHIQYPAEDYSLSINIMPASFNLLKNDQFWFDMNTNTIRSIAQGVGTARNLIFELASIFGNSETIGILDSFANSNTSLVNMRIEAINSFNLLTKENIWHKIKDDKNPKIKAYAQRIVTNGQ